jgi:hypothetical protein
MSKYPQLTLRELLLGVLFIGLGCAALVAGGVMATIFLGVALILTVCFAIVAFVGRDEPRAAAIGFSVPVTVYAASIFAVGSSELDPYGHLPTTKLIQPTHPLIVRQEWINAMTGELIPDHDPTTAITGPGFLQVSLRETPDRATFMSVAHTLLAIVFGYAGSKFAVYVHRRQKPLVNAGGTG